MRTNSKRTMVILRGVSGAGKSTVANLFSGDGHKCHHWEADQYHYNDEGVYDWKPENLKAAHEWCREMAEMSCRADCPCIIVSNTNTSESEIKPYLQIAGKYGYEVVSLIVENRHGNNSIHNVPQHVRDSQESRLRESIKLQ